MNIIIFDTETTGVEPLDDRLVELAGVDLRSEFPHFSTLVNPQRDIPPEAKAVHHITEVETDFAPDERTALTSMLQHFHQPELILCAHNAKFDRGFVERINPGLNPAYICTYKCAITAWPDAPGYSNQVLRYWLGLDLSDELPPGLFPHRALYDCIVTRGILRRLLQDMSIARLIDISSRPVLLSKVSFGKHKGDLWSNVPFGYLKWCLSQSDMNEDVLFTARYYMGK